MKQLLTVVFSVSFKLLVSACHSTLPINKHFLQLWPSRDNIPILTIVNLDFLVTSICRCFISYSGMYTLVHSSRSRFGPQWLQVSEGHHLCFYSTSEVTGTYQSLGTCSLSCLRSHLQQTLWKPVLLWVISCVEPWLIADDLKLIISNPSITQNHGTGLFSVLIISGCECHPNCCVPVTVMLLFLKW